jgi:hypothetical protein
MKLVNPYHWLYVKMYLLQLVSSGKAALQTGTIIGMLAMLSLNLVLIAASINILFDIQILRLLPSLTVNKALLCLFLWTVANFFYFFYKGRYKKILLEFDVESKLKEPYCYMPGLIYVVLSILSLFLLIPLRVMYGAH